MSVTISNPPYNIKWQHPLFAQMQPRFSRYGLPKESNANWAFILTALEQTAKCIFIMPTGILADNEKEIRKQVIEDNLIEAIILCPDEMFEKTSIRVCIMVFNKNKSTAKVEFVDMRQSYVEEERLQNGQFGGSAHTNRTYKKVVKSFSDEHINLIVEAIQTQRNEKMLCKSVGIEEVRENNYLLNPSRYIEFEELEIQTREYSDIIKDLNAVIKEKNGCKLTINETLARTLGFDIDLYKKRDLDKDFKKTIKEISGEDILKEDYFTATKNKLELKFENKGDENISSILMMILQSWKQHIYYLNIEENRYLVELRDKVIPDLMSGKLEVDRE